MQKCTSNCSHADCRCYAYDRLNIAEVLRRDLKVVRDSDVRVPCDVFEADVAEAANARLPRAFSLKHDGTAGLVADGTAYTDGTAIQLLVEQTEQPTQTGQPFMEQTRQPRQLCRCVTCVSSVPVVDETQWLSRLYRPSRHVLFRLSLPTVEWG